MVFGNLFWNTLSFFYGFVYNRPIFSFLPYHKISSLPYIKKALENHLHDSCTGTSICSILLVLFSCKVIGFWKLGITVIHTVIILDTLYVIDVVITYTYIFVLYKRHAKLRKISYNGRITHDQFKFTVPTLVITTYILFTVFPHFWTFCMIIKSLDEIDFNSYRMCRILFLLGWLADPLIYVSKLYLAKCKCKVR